MTTAAICASREVSWSPSFYRGEQLDPDLGLYYLRARYMSPLTGRFLSRDLEDGIVADPKTLHKYDYAGGDPVNAIDPTGRSALVEYLMPIDIIDLGHNVTHRKWDKYTHQYVVTSGPANIVALKELACAVNALYVQGAYTAQGIFSEADFVGCTAFPVEYAELCTRPFYPVPVRGPLHCFIRYNGDNGDTSSFDLNGVHSDPAPSWWGVSCHRINGGPNNNCLRDEMRKCTADQFSIISHNCCDCAEKAIERCGLSLPFGALPNWPINR